MPILINTARSQVLKHLNKYFGFNGKAIGTNGLYNITSECPIQYPKGDILKMKLTTGNTFQLRVLHFLCGPNALIIPMTPAFREMAATTGLGQHFRVSGAEEKKLNEYVADRHPRNEVADLVNGVYNWLAYYGSDTASYSSDRYRSKFYFMRAEDVIKCLKKSVDEIENEAFEGMESHAGQIFGQANRAEGKDYVTAYISNDMFATYNKDQTKKLAEKYGLPGWSDWSILYDIMNFSDVRTRLARTDGLRPLEEKAEEKPKIQIIKHSKPELLLRKRPD